MEIAARQTRSLSRRVSSHEMAGPLVISSPQLSFSSPPLSSAMISAQLHSPLVTLQKAPGERARGTRIPPTSEAFKKVLHCLAPVSASPSSTGLCPATRSSWLATALCPSFPRRRPPRCPYRQLLTFPCPPSLSILARPCQPPLPAPLPPCFTLKLPSPPSRSHLLVLSSRFGCRTPLINSCSNRSAENLASSHHP